MLNPKSKNEKKSEIQTIPLEDCLAKTIKSRSGNKPGVSVATHCRIVGYVAREIMARMPAWLSEGLFPKGSELIAAAHDLGKISPAFQEKIHHAVGERLGIISPELDSIIGYHSAVSQAALPNDSPKYIREILGRHHGYTPSNIEVSDAEIYGGPLWQTMRMDLLQILKKGLGVDWPVISSALQSDVIAGLTTVADWIGSGSLFDEANHESWRGKISEALDRAGFVAPAIRNGLGFEDIFGFQPRNVQKQFIEAVTEQGAYVLEAPMGIGKTEAALYAAYKIFEKQEATGIYFALPTRLTSDKIYERMNQFLSKILDASDKNRSSLLLHSSAWLQNTEIGEDGAPGRSWFNSSKRGLLAPFAVGTIDQALMAVMNVKHGFVRTFGLAGKVVILDEVHSYDSYTGTILNELVKALRELHCTVIILSATLTGQQRRSILGTSASLGAPSPAYPLISIYPREGNLLESPTEKLEKVHVTISITSSDDEAFEEALKRAERGEQVLWIENTVQDAQKQYQRFASKEMNIDCGLLHSRFLKVDRQKNEDRWVGIYGKTGRVKNEYKGRILVGTQVLEQSLDIDADFLVTRICPTDMLFQRIGRLWRHAENDSIRPVSANREAWVLAPDLKDAIQDKKAFGKSARVYSPYILCRTLSVWQNISSLILPDDIRSTLEGTYADRLEQGNLSLYKQDIEKKRETLSRLALAGVSRGGKTLPESKAATRYSETESIEVLLIKKMSHPKSGTLLRLLDDSELLLPNKVDLAERRRITVQLLNNTVMVPEYLAPQTTRAQLTWLEDYIYLGDNRRDDHGHDEECPFRAAVVQDSGELQGIGYADISDKYVLNYDACLGYRAGKKGKEDDDGE